MKQTKAEKAKDKAEGLAYLHKHLKKGDKVYTVLRHVSGSGMYRVVALYIVKRGKITWITKYAAWAMESRWDDNHNGIGVGGCGFDVGSDTVMNLSYALHGVGKQDEQGEYILRCKCEERLAVYYLSIYGTPRPPACVHKPGYTLKHEWL